MVLTPVNAGQPLHVSDLSLGDHPECREVSVCVCIASYPGLPFAAFFATVAKIVARGGLGTRLCMYMHVCMYVCMYACMYVYPVHVCVPDVVPGVLNYFSVVLLPNSIHV